MSEGINQVMLMGNLGADPELKHTSVGSVLKFSLATTRYWHDKENAKKEETIWHRVTIFGRRAEALQKFLSKGTRVFVMGRIHNSSYEKDGQKRYSSEIICDDLRFAGGGDRASSSSSSSASTGFDAMKAMPPPAPASVPASFSASAGNGGYSRRPAQPSLDEIPF